MITTNIDQYIEVGRYLEEMATVSLLEKFKENVERKSYFLPFIGQFSAGKSKLINHILGKKILPTKSVETTAFLTYIAYGEQESAELFYVDGTTEKVDIAKIHSLDQDATKDSRAIASLQIMMPLDVLKSGLIIVDTPGVNTLISEHVRMTEELLQSSQYVVYVTGMAPTATDIQMMKQIHNLNIPMVFVRNKADLIHLSEENPVETIKKEKSTICEALSTNNVVYFAISNDESVREKEVWKESFNFFMSYLTEDIAKNVAQLFEASIKSRLQLIREKFLRELEQKESLYRISSTKSVDELMQQQVAITTALSSLNRDIEKNVKSMDRRKSNLSDAFKSELKSKEREVKENFNEKLLSVNKDDNYAENVKTLYKNELPTAFDALGEIATKTLKEFSDDSTEEIQADLQRVAQDMKSSDIDFSCDFDLSKVEEIATEQANYEAQVAEKLANIEQLKSMDEQALAEIGVKKSEMEQGLAQYDQAIQEAQTIVKEFTQNHQVSFVEIQGKLGERLRNVGKVLDIATVLIPAAGWTKIASYAGKAANTVKTLAGTRNVGLVFKEPILKALNRIKDGANGRANQKSGLVGASNMQSGGSKANIFDYLSISHWMGKLGETLDPPHLEVDTEKENQFQEECRQKRAEVNLLVQQRVEQYRRQIQVEDEERLKQREKVEREKAEARLKAELEEKSREFESQKREKFCKDIATQIVEKYASSVSDYAEMLKKRLSEELESLSQKIIQAANLYATQQLNDSKAQLEQIVEKRKSCQQNDEDYFKTLSDYKSKLVIADE